MNHKTQSDRSKDAAIRKRRYLPRLEAQLKEVVSSKEAWSQRDYGKALSDAAYKLQQAYIAANYSREEADGFVRAILMKGNGDRWISGPDISAMIERMSRQ